MDLSIIIVNWKAKELLKNCIFSIIEHKSALNVQVIVVDNDSSDGSNEMVHELFPDIRLINSGGNIGFAKANNLAVPYAEAPIILFLNPDTIIKENTLQGMINFLNDHESVGAIGCKIRDINGNVQDVPTRWVSPTNKFLELLFMSDKTMKIVKQFITFHDPNISIYGSYLYGACLMVRKITLDQIGLFDERFFMYCEDVDLCHRIFLGGWKIYYISEYEIIHLIGGSTAGKDSDFTHITMCESISKLMHKYYGKRGRIIYKYTVLFSSFLKLIALSVLKTKSHLVSMKRQENYQQAMGKHKTLIKWSLM